MKYPTQSIIGSDEWTMRQDEFTINEQCASIVCICDIPLEVYNNLSTTCECGRQYRIETVLHVEWAVKNENDYHDDTEIDRGI